MPRVRRPSVPVAFVERVRAVLAPLPRVQEEDAWTGVRWRIGGATVAHVFGGEDQLFRLTFRGESDEVMAFRHLGAPYFHVGGNAIGMLVDETTDWAEVAELLTDSYCVQAPEHLAARVERPGSAPLGTDPG